MEITGKIIHVLPETTGVSKAGKPWKKREYVLETLEGQYPQKILFDFFGERADQYPLTVGQIIKLSFDINSREYNGRWFTNISGWRVEEVGEQVGGNNNVQTGVYSTPQNANQYGQPNGMTTPPPPVDLNPSGPDDDLPF